MQNLYVATSKLNLTGWHDVPVDHISFWDNEILKMGKRRFKFIMTPHVHHWDSMMVFEETIKSLLFNIYYSMYLLYDESIRAAEII
jgi:flavorubredoxin